MLSVWKTTGLLSLFAVAGMQFLPIYRRTNPATVPARTLAANVQLSPLAAGVLDRACRNCHSNETRWPWYSRIAPVSWLVVRDVEKGRRTMNFSEWSTGITRKPGVAASFLAAACEDLRTGRMPNPRYLLLHPEARVSPAEVQAFCDWSRTEGKRLRAMDLNMRRAGRR
jgi:hypothetical protein